MEENESGGIRTQAGGNAVYVKGKVNIGIGGYVHGNIEVP